MVRILILYIALGLLLIGCSKKSKEEKLMSEDQLVHLLADMHVIDALMMRTVNRGMIKNREVDNYYKGVLVKYNITRSEFDSIYNYYSQDYGRLEKIYDKVLVEIKKRKEILDLEKRKATVE